MITEDYVSFEIAKLLKEKGFNEKLKYYYDSEEILIRCNRGEYFNNEANGAFIAPTLQMAMKYLREVHNINIDIVPIWDQKRFEYQVFVVTPENAKHCYIDDKLYLGYEQACEAALRYCLENLIK